MFCFSFVYDSLRVWIDLNIIFGFGFDSSLLIYGNMLSVIRLCKRCVVSTKRCDSSLTTKRKFLVQL